MKKIILTILMTMFCSISYADNLHIAYETSTGKIIQHNRGGGQLVTWNLEHTISNDTCSQAGVSCLFNQEYPNLPNVPFKYWIVDTNIVSGTPIREMSLTEKINKDLEIASQETTGKHDKAKSDFDNIHFRAFVKILIQEINILRQDIDAMSKEDVKITDRNRPDRTVIQLRNAINNEIDSGGSD